MVKRSDPEYDRLYKLKWRQGDRKRFGNCIMKDCPTAARYPTGLCHAHHMLRERYGRFERINAVKGSGHTCKRSGYRWIMVNKVRWAEHIYVATQALGKPLPKGAVVHHVNGIGSDNRPENLVICPSQSYHRLLHIRQDALRPIPTLEELGL